MKRSMVQFIESQSGYVNSDWYKNLKLVTFISLGLSIPLTTAGISISMVLLFIYWVLERNYCIKIQELCKNPVFIATFAFFILHLVGQYWLDGVKQINGFKSWMVFIIPVLASVVDVKTAKKGLIAFVIGMLVSDVWLITKILSVWDQYSKGLVDDLGGFYISGSRISFAPMIVIAFSILFSRYLYGITSGIKKYILIFTMIIMVFSIFYTGGRGGQITFIISWLILTFIHYKKNNKKLTYSVLVLITILTTSYFTSAIFNNRVNLIITEVMFFIDNNQDKKYQTSVGRRLHYIENGIDLFKDKPWLGYGTGSYENVASDYLYVKNDDSGNKFLSKTTNPHNYHLLVLIQFGIIGFLIYLSIFATQIYVAIKAPNNYKYKGVAFLIPVLYFLICFNDTYLWSHQLQATFALLTSIVYRQDLWDK